MKNRHFVSLLCHGLVLSVTLACASSAAWAQTATNDGTTTPAPDGVQAAEKKGGTPSSTEADSGVADILVTGQRLGFSTTSQIKRDAPQSVSVLTTTDLRNIPDTILIDIVRRVPGLQVSQGGGGGVVSIRGLSQTESRLNGRNFPSAISRTFDIATLPGDLVSGVAVYKTPTADQIEGGIAGIIDFRTRRPFDFDGVAGSFTAKGVYTNLDKQVDPVVSGYLSNRWSTGIGDFGVLVGGSFQRQRNALHLLTTDGNTTQTGTGGQAIAAPTTVYKRYFVNTKNVSTGYGALQWRDNAGLEMSLDLLYNRSSNVGGLQNLGAALSQGTPTSAFALYPNSNIFRSGTYANVPLNSTVDRFGGTLRAFQAGYNATYTNDRVTITGDAAYTRSSAPSFGAGVQTATTAPSIAYNADQVYPAFVVSGVDPKSSAAYRYTGFYQSTGLDRSEDTALRLDGTYRFDGALRTIQVGLRYDRRTIKHDGGFAGTDAPAGIAPVSQNPFAQLTAADLYRNQNIPQPQWATIGYTALGGGIGTLRGVLNAAPVANDPAQRYDGSEKALTSYAMATFAFPVAGIPIDGNIGVRVVKTDLAINASRRVGTGPLMPQSNSSSYTDVLPSVNLRLTLAPELFLRLAYSKQLNRPGFSQLAPITTLLPQATSNGTGSTGNPDLKPLRASQFDASLEHYFGADNSIYVAGFYKDVNGFISNETVPLSIGGITYLITRPQNRAAGYIAGAEVGYRQAFSFLPGVLSGLGVQGSYTYVNGTKSPNPAGYVVPYEQITRHNYQLSGFYNKYGISANVNWVWRSRLLEASSGDVGGRPDYRIPFGQLDANLVYALTPKVNLVVSGVNLTQSLIRRSYLDPRYFGQDALENRRFLAGVQIKLGGGI